MRSCNVKYIAHWQRLLALRIPAVRCDLFHELSGSKARAYFNEMAPAPDASARLHEPTRNNHCVHNRPDRGGSVTVDKLHRQLHRSS